MEVIESDYMIFDGKKMSFADSEARAQLKVLGDKDYPVGFVLVSTIEIDPSYLFGGTWMYDADHHGFAGHHIYTKVADDIPELPDEGDEGEPDDAPESEEVPNENA